MRNTAQWKHTLFFSSPRRTSQLTCGTPPRPPPPGGAARRTPLRSRARIESNGSNRPRERDLNRSDRRRIRLRPPLSLANQKLDSGRVAVALCQTTSYLAQRKQIQIDPNRSTHLKRSLGGSIDSDPLSPSQTKSWTPDEWPWHYVKLRHTSPNGNRSKQPPVANRSEK